MNKQLKYLLTSAIIIFAFMIYFTHSFASGLKLGIAAIMLWLIPGYTLLHLLIKDMEELNKIILGVFIGFGFTALVLYYLNVIGFTSIKPLFSYGIGIVCLLILVVKNFKKTQRQES